MKATYIHDELIHNSEAAMQVLPLLFDIYKPASILDVGCGLGNWIEVAKKLNIPEVLGIDGSYVNKKLLKIAENEFVEKDLTQPFSLDKKFDLIICLEVAEHLPTNSSEGFIFSLTQHADVILFSAAIPGQGGQYHINEQWPSYWQKLFNKYNYEMIDYFRPKIWNNKKIERWYKQNLFLVVKKEHPLTSIGNNEALSLVHPELLEAIEKLHVERVKNLQNTIHRLQSRDIIGKIARIFKKKGN